MNPFDPSLFTVSATCLPCCTTPTPGCSCALLFGSDMGTVPPTPYASYADAAAAIASQTSNCIAFAVYNNADSGESITVTFDGTTITAALTAASSMPTLGVGVSAYFSVSLKAGAMLTIPWSVSTDGPAVGASTSLLNCADGSLVDNDVSPPGGPSSGTFTLTAPSDGEYIFEVFGGGTLGITSFGDLSFTVTCDMTYWVNPVIALWDDSGTTRSLWACPKLLLPPLTESTGDWYASCADAASDIAAGTSNCVGYAPLPGDSFTATDGGTSLTLNGTQGLPSHNMFSMWGGVNAIGGQTLSAAFSTNGGSPIDSSFDIYDDMGVLVESLTGGTTLTSAPLPYTGRYTIVVHAGSGAGGTFTDATTIITSSGTMSVNPIQARYDIGLTCAGTLDCGDSCP